MWAPPLAAESFWARASGLALLDATAGMVLGTALGWVSGWSERPLARWAIALSFLGPALWSGLVLDRIARTPFTGDAIRAPLRLERPLPRLASEQPRALVLITLDTVRADGLAHMPKLSARLARRYPEARAAASWTLPSVASMHTGLDEVAHGAGQRTSATQTHARTPLGDVPTLAEQLQDRGFITGAVVSNPYLGSGHGLSRGFDRLHDVSRTSVTRYALRRALLGRLLLAPLDADAAGVGALATAMLPQLRDGRFFLWLHYTDSHAPYRDDGRHTLDPCEQDCFADWHAARDGAPVDRARARALYASELGRLDGALVPLLDRLDDLDASVLVVGDHGEAFGEGADVEHGHAFTDEVLRVPFGAWGPHVPPGVIHTPVDVRAVHDVLLGLSQGRWDEPSTTPLPMRSKLFGAPEETCWVGARVEPDCVPPPERTAQGAPVTLGLEALGYVE